VNVAAFSKDKVERWKIFFFQHSRELMYPMAKFSLGFVCEFGVEGRILITSGRNRRVWEGSFFSEYKIFLICRNSKIVLEGFGRFL
jgi:hypothetical protein